MSAPFKMSCAKHDGAEHFKVMQWDGKKFQILTRLGAGARPGVHSQADRKLGSEVCRREQHYAAQVLLIDRAG